MTDKHWLRTNGVNTMGPLQKLTNFDGLGKKVRPGTFGQMKVGERENPKSPAVKKHEICSDPISADLICPFPLASDEPHAVDLADLPHGPLHLPQGQVGLACCCYVSLSLL